MNTERLAVLLLGLLLLACSTSEDGPDTPPTDTGVQTQYTFLLASNSGFSAQSLEADALTVVARQEKYPLFSPETTPITYRDGKKFGFLQKHLDCTESLFLWDGSADPREVPGIFDGDANCERLLIGLANLGAVSYIAYSLPGTGLKEVHYYIKALSHENGQEIYPDVEVQKQPLQLVGSGNRLFLLTYDIATGKNSLQVFNGSNGEEIAETDLGTGVLQLLKLPGGQVLAGYESRHLILDPNSLEVLSRVQYTAGKEPRFANANTPYFDPSGILYYPMPTGLINSNFEHISGIYDFSRYTAYLYYYENFLSAQRIADYAIGDTKMVAFDHHNGLLLIGYAKSGSSGLGGLLRIKPVPEPKFVDHIALEGIPLQVIVQ